ncbi:DoxX family protein [Pseudopelagicola sp. nBUS_20]|uniref:DoxX family protein n=1 Tax=Pseudopelagicola sp. nBUS_20 TaxID=3395317 RepID=UPI003EBFB1DD
MQKYILIIIKIILTLAFAAASFFKLSGQEMMMTVFENIGIGQWFRFVTGVIELGAVLLIWAPGRQFFGAAVLVCTMIGAVLVHLVLIGGSPLPAVLLGALAGWITYTYRDQSPVS